MGQSQWARNEPGTRAHIFMLLGKRVPIALSCYYLFKNTLLSVTNAANSNSDSATNGCLKTPLPPLGTNRTLSWYNPYYHSSRYIPYHRGTFCHGQTAVGNSPGTTIRWLDTPPLTISPYIVYHRGIFCHRQTAVGDPPVHR